MDIVDILGRVGFDWRMALANLVNFLIIYYILRRFAFEPIKQVLDNRATVIKRGEEDAQKAASELVMAKSNYEQQMAAARKEAQEIVAKSHERGSSIVAQATTDAETQAAGVLADARALIEKEKEQMHRELEHKTADVAVSLAEKIIHREVTPETEQAVINDLVRERT